MTQYENDHDGDATARRDALAERLFQSVLQTLELGHVWLGDRLGLYAALADLGDVTPAELAKATGIAERYAREWLEQQAVAAMVDVAVPNRNPAARRYRLPPGCAEVFLDPDSLRHRVPIALQAVGVLRTLPQLKDAFRTGSGVPYADYGDDMGNIAGNRAKFTQQLATEWLPHLPDVHARLTGGAALRVADIGCGRGWSSIAIARAFPAVRVDAIDLDQASIDEAERNAAAAGVADRVTFRCAGAATLAGSYDLICAFECLHDMSDPVAALRAARESLGPDGVLLVAEERLAEEFVAPGDDIERFQYAWSALSCLPASLSEQPSAAIGSAIRPATVRSLALSAGFTGVEDLPIEHDLWLFYRFVP
ncbi:MAG TPA: class I SAM-dependent methyltransferase [Streptosporangiaceae bacterium]|jgi:SAM-dependent methyltransferase